MAAVKLGASAMVGIDIDPQALQATRENASRNHVSAQVEAFLPEHAPAQQYNVVLANILAAPLRELKEIIAGYCQSGGQIILSGILVEQAEEIANLYSEFFVIDHIAHSGEWASINGTKR